MKVTMVPEGTTMLNTEAHIGRMAAICYDGGTDDTAAIKRARKCKDNGHSATMRFAFATFNIAGISRACSHQLVRVAHAGILQRSQRYCKESNVEYVRPPALADMPEWLRLRWLAIEREAEQVYNLCITNGMKKGDARYILPQGVTTEVNMCLNFQAWQAFLKIRDDAAAQWEIREVAVAIRDNLRSIAPGLF